MGNIRRSEPGLFGSYTHYDEYGNKVGSSSPGLFGGYINYDKYGNKTGNSYKNFSGGYSSYDNYGNYIGCHIRICSAGIPTEIPAETGRARQTHTFSAGTNITRAAKTVVTSQRVCTAHMIVRRSGHCADSVITV